jgi:DNA polymerase-3 subunit delta'
MAVGVDADGALPLPWLAPALKRALQVERSHALLLHAAIDVGQLDLALCVAQAWLCEQRDRAPCGNCGSCRLVRQRTHPDLCIVVPDAQRVEFGWIGEDEALSRAGAKPSRDIRIEQVRDAIEWTQRSASTPCGRALVIAPVEALNPASASALLKTLEEPPGALRIALAGRDPERLLPTVRSRVQRVRLGAPTPAQSLAWLQEQGLPASARALAVAGDSPLGAAALVQAGLDDRVLDALPRAIASGDAPALMGQPVPLVVDLLLRLVHDAMAQAAGAPPRFYDASRMPPAAPLPALIEWQRELLRVAPNDEHPWNAPLLVEALVTKGARCWAAAPSGAPRRADHSIHSAR